MKKILLFLLLFLLLYFNFPFSAVIAQNDKIYVMKSEAVVGKYNVYNQVDSVIYYKPKIGSSNTVIDIDGNVYDIVTIGSQVWMAENLKTTKYADGTPIPLTNTRSTWNAITSTSKAYCWYDNDISNKATYGALYTWAAAMNGAASVTANPSGIQGVCPTGWHLPSDAEWTQLTNYLGGESVAGGKLKGTELWYPPNISATNETDFTALPGGDCDYYGTFYHIERWGYWWCATEHSSEIAYYRSMRRDLSSVGRHSSWKSYAYSVRCVRD
ncbi:MAG TPA: FISUMP domain-containing protein [Bacteroidales bacterium]|nr:FISUMP domain-containing protein [Bacteroidales bacterium]